MMGAEFELYEITALTLIRNDARVASFTAQVHQMEERARTLPATPHWCKTPRDVVRFPARKRSAAVVPAAHCALRAFAARCVTAIQASALSPELDSCKAGIEKAGISGARLASMGEFELAQLAAPLLFGEEHVQVHALGLGGLQVRALHCVQHLHVSQTNGSELRLRS